MTGLISRIINAPAAPAGPAIRYVEVYGNSRIPADSILRQVSAAPNAPYVPAKLQADLKNLYALGFFENVQVQSCDAGEGLVDVVYQIREYPFISGFLIEGVDSKLEEQIRNHLKAAKLGLHPATAYRPEVGHRVALSIRDYLRSRKYPNAEVQISTERRGDSVNVLCSVQPGRRLEVGSVRFTGNNSISHDELLRQMQFACPGHFWARWGGAARYVPNELHLDLQRIRQYYLSQGFATVSVGMPRVHASTIKSKQRIDIEIPIAEGLRYRLISAKVEGSIRTGATDVDQIMTRLHTPSDYDYSLLESARQKIAETLGHHGYALAWVQLEQSLNEPDKTVQVVFRVDSGGPVAIGKIVFQGNRHIPDKFLRRELSASEGEIFDTAKLDKSVERLNKTNLLQKMQRSDVALKLNEETSLLDVTFKVKEKDRQGIYATGGTSDIGGGYLGVLYTALNFLHLGEVLSLELDGGAAQSSMLLNIVGTHFLGSPFTVALSVFNKYTGFNLANVVPGPDSLVGVLRRRSRGAGLSGSYPLTGHLNLGLGFEAQRESISNEPSANAVSSNSVKSELAPFVLFDHIRKHGSKIRGYALSYSQGWDGSLFLRSLDSTRQSFQFSQYAGDPLSKSRNTLAFHLHGSWVRPSGNGPLFPERRFYPGNESVRGFSRGSLSPLAVVPGNSGLSLQSAGADTVLRVSTEYRVPIRGPLSGVGFLDMGWAHLDPRSAVQLSTGARIIDRTNGILRISLGGELRLQLPIINQPARMISSWNPLRLNTLFNGSPSVFRLVEPKTSFRFALGSLF